MINKIDKHNGGFTLIELLTVMAIMLIIMAMAVGAFLDWGRGSGMRGALIDVKSAMVNTRQKAITERKKTQFVFGNTNTEEKGWFGYYYYLTITNFVKSAGLASSTNYLPTGVIFGDKSYNEIKGSNIVFKLDGTCPGGDDRYLSLVEKIGRDKRAYGKT